MDYAFSTAQHDRSAFLRKGQWMTPNLLVMVVGGEHVSANLGADGQGKGIRWLTVDAAPQGEWVFLGYRGEQGFAAVMVDRVAPEFTPLSLRMLGPSIAPEDASLAVNAVGLARWHQTNTHCSHCGAVTRPQQAGHTRVCPSCGTEHFPRTDPAVIMLITDDQDRALLGRGKGWPEGRFSTLAGFVESGESLDDAVRREVKEETDIQVGGVTYAGSQPWPFPSSLMLGFFGHAQSTEVTVDSNEITEARWFTRQEVTELTAATQLLLPPIVSISRWLVEQWHGGEITGKWS